MTYLILFYVVLAIVGGMVIYSINSRAGKKKEGKKKEGKKKEIERKESLPETKPADDGNKRVVSSPGSTDVISDAEYREVLRKGLRTQADVKEKPAKDSLKYSDEEYREVLRTMHKRLHQNKESDS